jgi:hypothetical protein
MMVFAMLLTVVSKAVLDGFGTAFNKFGAAFAKTIDY